MTGPEFLTNPEQRARSAIEDYLSIGPEPNFGEIETTALDEWLAEADPAHEQLEPRLQLNIAWMHVERAWSRVAEKQGLAVGTMPPEIVEATRQDLAMARQLFRYAGGRSTDTAIRTHTAVAMLSLPMFGLVLSGREKDIDTTATAEYLSAQHGSLKHELKRYKMEGSPHDIPRLNALLGLVLLNGMFLETSEVALPSAYRHGHGRGSNYVFWHVLLHDRDNGRSLKVRIAPSGPPEMILLPPDLLGNREFPSAHGRGTVEAFAQMSAWLPERKIGVPPPPSVVRATEHMDMIDERVDTHITDQLLRIRGFLAEQERPEPTDYVAWYEGLSPYTDPCHVSHADWLEKAISVLEVRHAEGSQNVSDMYNLAWMHVESAVSHEARHSSHTNILNGSFDRAEDLLEQVRAQLPENSCRYFEATLAYIAVTMHRVIAQMEDTDQQAEVYLSQLVALADTMLDAYRSQPSDAEAIAQLLQHITVLVGCMASNGGAIVALPTTPRQRGSAEFGRGFDFTIWTRQGPDDLVPHAFSGRLDEDDDAYAPDNGVIVLPLKALGQWLPSHDFRTLRTALTAVDGKLRGKPDLKSYAKARRYMQKLIGGETIGMIK